MFVRSLIASLLIGVASANSVILNFEDLPLNNGASCAAKTFKSREEYHGIWPTFRVVNTTLTKGCTNLGQFHPATGAISGTNAIFAGIGESIQWDATLTDAFIGDVSADVAVFFTAKELAAKNAVVRVKSLLTDFGDSGGDTVVTFNTAKDGFGPYHVVFPDNGRYLEGEISVDVNLSADPSQVRGTSFYLDNLEINFAT